MNPSKESEQLHVPWDLEFFGLLMVLASTQKVCFKSSGAKASGALFVCCLVKRNGTLRG